MMTRIISIVNQKGGTGKSACAANLGAGLARKNKKVLIVDADPQSDVSASFGYLSERSEYSGGLFHPSPAGRNRHHLF